MIYNHHSLHGVILGVDQLLPWQHCHVVVVFLHLIQHPTNILIINISINPKFLDFNLYLFLFLPQTRIHKSHYSLSRGVVLLIGDDLEECVR